MLSVIEDTITVAKENLVSYSTEDLIGLASLFHESLISLAITVQDIFIHPGSNQMLEFFDVWCYTSYQLEHFFDGKLQAQSSKTYLPRISLLSGRPVYKPSFAITEMMFKNKAINSIIDGNEEKLEKKLKACFNSIHPNLYMNTQHVDKQLATLINNDQILLNGYSQYIKSAFTTKVINEENVPRFCITCCKFYAKPLTCCGIKTTKLTRSKYLKYIYRRFEHLNQQQQQVLSYLLYSMNII